MSYFPQPDSSQVADDDSRLSTVEAWMGVSKVESPEKIADLTGTSDSNRSLKLTPGGHVPDKDVDTWPLGETIYKLPKSL